MCGGKKSPFNRTELGEGLTKYDRVRGTRTLFVLAHHFACQWNETYLVVVRIRGTGIVRYDMMRRFPGGFLPRNAMYMNVSVDARRAHSEEKHNIASNMNIVGCHRCCEC